MTIGSKVWGFVKSPTVGVGLSILGLVLAFYTGFYFERRPALVFEIISNANVYDVHTNLGKLDIFYDGQNLRAHNKTLRLLSLRIINTGNADIVKSMYDDADPVGFSIKNGSILETSSVIGSSSYLNRRAKLTLSSAREVKLEPIILEAGEFIETRTLIVADPGASPHIESRGKVAGIKDIRVLTSEELEAQRLFRNPLSSLMEGAKVQASRIYVRRVEIASGIFALAGIGMAFYFFNLRVVAERRRARKTRAQAFLEGRAATKGDEFVIASYIDGGVKALVDLQGLFEMVLRRQDVLPRIADSPLGPTTNEILDRLFPVRLWRSWGGGTFMIEELQREGLLEIKGTSMTISLEVQQALTKLLEYLDTQGRD